MFNNQENLFLQAIQKMLSSTGNDARLKAESDIKMWAKESYIQILEACNKFAICEQLDPNIRIYACYLMTILISEENYENWEKVEENKKNEIKNNALGLLGNKLAPVRHSASRLVSCIEKILIKTKEWPNLITTLCNACDSNEDEFKISSIKTLGLIWESLNKDNFTNDEIILMEQTIIKIIISSTSLDLSYESLRAYQSFIKYISDKFANIDYLQSSLKMLTNYCDIQKYNEKISKTAIHRISDVTITAYDYMKTLIGNIIEFFGIMCNGENEELAIQSYIFLIELCQEEDNRMNIKMTKSNEYINSCWSTIWKIIQHTLNTTKDPTYNNEYNRYKALSSLLYYISRICKENIIDDIFIYMKEKMFDSNSNPLMINSAIYIFASILETNHYLKIKTVISSSIETLINYLKIQCEYLNNTVAWCFEKICENHGDVVIRQSDICHNILTMISTNLINENLSPKTKIYLCTSLYNLTEFVKNSELQKLGIFSQFLYNFLKNLDYLAYLRSSSNTDENLTYYCFLAISGLINSSQETDEEVLMFYLDQLLKRFTEATDTKNFGNKEVQYQVQSFLCMVLESFCKEGNKNKLTYTKIENFFNKIESFFKQRGIFEEGLQALSKLSILISNKEFSHFMAIIMEHIFNCLKDYQDFSNCKMALLCLIDLITTSKDNFKPYIEKIIQFFQEIIKKPDANKELFSYFLIVYSDLFEYIGESIWEYVQVPLDYMNYVLQFCINNWEKYLSDQTEKEERQYYLNLNDNVMDLIENILKRIINETNERKQAFFNYSPNIMYYLNFMLQKIEFVPNNDFILSCISTLFDLIEIYKDNILKMINDDTSRRLSQLANNTRDGEIISLNESLQNYIYTSNYNLQLNQDDIF